MSTNQILYYPQQQQKRPGTIVSIDGSKLGAGSRGSEKAIGVLGSALGGKPGEVVHLTSASQAKQVFRGGELVDAIEAMWNPSEDTSMGAGDIYAVRVDNAKQATKTINNVIFKSKLYGAQANNVTIKLAEGTQDGTYKFSVSDAGTLASESYDNLGNIATVGYSGTDAYAGISKQGNSIEIRVGSKKEDAVRVAIFDLRTSAFARIDDIASAISSVDGFYAIPNQYQDKNISTVLVDDFKEVNLKDAEKTLTSLLGDLAYQTAYSDLVEIEVLESDSVPQVTVDNVTKDSATVNAVAVTPLQPFPVQSLSGGDDGSVPTSWAPLFKALGDSEAENLMYISALTPSPKIHNELAAFIANQTAQGLPLRGFVGGDINESVNRLLSRRADLNNSRISLMADTVQVRMSDGRLSMFPPYMTAAFPTGLASYLDRGEAITFKSLRIVKILTDLGAGSAEILYNNGIIGIEKNRTRNSSRFQFTSDTTTKKSTYSVETDMSLGEQTDFLATSIREELDKQYIGGKTSEIKAVLIKTSVSGLFLQLKNQGELIDYSEENIHVTIDGTQVYISASAVVPSQEIKNIYFSLSYDSKAYTV